MSVFRIGHGYDVHRLVENRKLIMGGIDIPYDKGLEGHSDADVVAHALIDSLLGAAALGDIGSHFPDSDSKYKNISSLGLLANIIKLITENGYTIVNIDVTIIAENPKLNPYVEAIRDSLSKTMMIPVDCISIKAKTNEKIGFIGRGEGIAAFAVAMIKK